jgi:peptidoglycan/LPS O-acetylase OafA/YrhL
MSTGKNDRLLSLDVARGIAALGVVVYHWGHFYLATGDVALAAPATYPFFNYLSWPYHNGWIGVDFFFVLSGAIFFTKYADAIAARQVTGWQFFVLRFSRLYPLHLATLILVAALQAAIFAHLGHFIIYQANDPAHFLVNLLFIQDWGFFPLLSDISFNAPAWSLSIEVFLYITFFVLFRYVPANILWFALIAFAGLLLRAKYADSAIGRGLWCFFMGGSIAWCCKWPAWARYFKPALYGVTAVVLCLLVIGAARDAMMEGLQLLLGRRSPSPLIMTYVLYSTFLAGVVGCLILWDRTTHKFTRPIAFLGDISYSSYLLHFPLQLTVILAIVLLKGEYTIDLFNSPWMFLVFFAVLIALSLASFHWFEAPARQALRVTMLAKRVSLPPLSGLLPESPMLQPVEHERAAMILLEAAPAVTADMPQVPQTAERRS